MCLAILPLCFSCEILDDGNSYVEDQSGVTSKNMAVILSSIPLEHNHLAEVHDAVLRSSNNGYDEEYTLKHLFSSPGSGVGDTSADVKSSHYDNPLCNLVRSYITNLPNHSELTKSATEGDRDILGTMSPDEFIEGLSKSGMQIYWPYSENWDGQAMPVMTFDPEDNAKSNIAYRPIVNADGQLNLDADGNIIMETIMVDESYAREHPVWIINTNRDAGFKTLDMMRKDCPDLEGGSLVIPGTSQPVETSIKTKEEPCDGIKTLILKKFKSRRQFDNFFAGGSEFFIKIGYIDDFLASTEAEMRVYTPMVTDFMIVVKRSQVGQPIDVNTVLVSSWTGDDLYNDCAFLILEDDGGKRTKWKCEAVVKYKSKSFGAVLDIPLNTRDDIVWRGHITSTFMDEYVGFFWAFGDVEVMFDIVDSRRPFLRD